MATLFVIPLTLLIILFPSSLLVQCVSPSQKGISIKLIHSDSMESPLYPGNLSTEERLSRFHNTSRARMKQRARVRAAARGHAVQPDIVRPPVITEGSYYLALVGIGTFVGRNPDYLNYYLAVDTGSDLIWTQCQGCNPCFPQKEALYPYMNSQTFQPARPCNTDRECDLNEDDYCFQGRCFYKAAYGSGTIITEGPYALDRFTFHSDNGGTESLQGVTFGCGLNQKGFGNVFGKQGPGEATGILGMGAGKTSFINQFDGGRIFSICFPGTITQGKFKDISTFLRFGADAKFKPNQQPKTTPLSNNDGFLSLNLVDISVGDVRLNFPPGAFQYDPEEDVGGFEVDTGSPLTIMQPEILDILIEKLRLWYSNFDGLEEFSSDDYDLCYRMRLDFNSYQSITLHFQNNADFKLTTNQLYVVAEDHFCLAIVGAHENFDVSVLFGNFMLSNRRIIFDIENGQMSFADEYCDIGS